MEKPPTERQEDDERESGIETMESLLAQQAAVSEKLSGKEIAWVKVIQLTKDQVLVDIGEKREGVVPLSEFKPQGEEPSQKAEGLPGVGQAGAPAPGIPAAVPPKVGQRIPVMRVGPRRDGTTLLSYSRARAEIAWEAAAKAFSEKARVRGQVRSAIKGGFLVDLGGVSGFLPASLADLRPVRSPERMVGMGVRCRIIELNQSKRQLVVSRKAVLEEEMAKRRAKLLAELRVGEVRIGRIVHASPAGLIVDIGGVEGFVRAEDIAWGAPKPPAQERGSKAKVKVLSKPQKDGQAGAPAPGIPAAVPPKGGERVGLGIKQLYPNPADAIRKKYPPKSVVRGKVVEGGPAGLKIVLEDKRAARCAASERDPEAAYKAGDAVSAIVLGVDPDTFELTVSLNKYSEIQDRKRVAQYLKAPKPLTLGQLLSPEEKET